MKKDSLTANHGHRCAKAVDGVLTVDKRPQGGRYVNPETVPKGSGEFTPELIDNLIDIGSRQQEVIERIGQAYQRGNQGEILQLVKLLLNVNEEAEAQTNRQKH